MCIFKKVNHTFFREETEMSTVKNSLVPILPVAVYQYMPQISDISDVRYGTNEFAIACQFSLHFLQDIPRVKQMFQHIVKNNHVKVMVW